MMIPAAKTVYYFSFYLYVVGLVLMVAPNFLLQIFHLPQTQEVWIRVVGVLVFCIGFYYNRNAITNNLPFLKSTIPTRLLVLLAFTAFALLEFVSPVTIIFGAIDGLGALCTWYALRATRRATSS